MESVFLPVLGELALSLPELGGPVPRGKLEPFFLLSPAFWSLFILFIISRTDLGLSLGTVGFSVLSTLVTSPDFRSTPTMDQGRGLGRGLGLGLK